MAFRLGVGPMSAEIIRILSDISNEHSSDPLMIIASMNQIGNSGYVMNTETLSEMLQQLGSNMLLCRDHCGPGFNDETKHLSIDEKIAEVKATIKEDIEAGFDLIHIDTSRCGDLKYTVADQLFDFALNLNPNIRFEFGSEENIGVAVSIDQYKKDVDFCSKIPNIEYIVGQTGSLVYEDLQRGIFDTNVARQLVAIAESNNFKLKEHNADYLTPEEISLRKEIGIHAVNIAPQLGVVQTQVTLELANQFKITDSLYDYMHDVEQSKKWMKWTNSDNLVHRTVVAGHYCFNKSSYRKLLDSIGHDVIYDKLKERITHLIRSYIE